MQAGSLPFGGGNDSARGICTGLQTGLTNHSEGFNRIVKHVGRIAFGFSNPDNQRRQVRWACIRQSQRVTPSQHQCHC